MTFIKPKRRLAIALETTSGTAIATADATMNVKVRDIEFDPEIEMYLRPFASGRHSAASAVMGKKKATVTFKYDMVCGAAAGTAPNASKLFQACGALETVTASTSVGWTPLATKDEGNSVTATIRIYETPTSGSSLIYTMKGCMGNCVVSMDELGNPFSAAFTFQGAFVSIADGTASALTSPDSGEPPATIGATITHASDTLKIGKFSLDFGNDVQLDYDPSDSTGYLAAYIANRAPKLTINPKAELVATDAHYTRWAAGTTGAFSFASATSGGLKWTISAPAAQLSANKLGDRNSAVTFEQEYILLESSGNDEWQILQSA
jgi:hypothetical protein